MTLVGLRDPNPHEKRTYLGPENARVSGILPFLSCQLANWMQRLVRIVECIALEMRHTGNRIEGSNPSLSATGSFSRAPYRALKHCE